jgi:hypothetical protein
LPFPPFHGDQLSLSDAQRRYSLGKTALNARINHCQIQPVRSGTRGFLTGSQIRVLDQLHDHLASGRGMSDFESPFIEAEIEPIGEPSAIVPTNHNRDQYLEVSATPAVGHIQALQERLEFLSLCSREGWQLPTSDIRAILGASPRRDGWTRYGFTFEAVGTHGQETAWAVHLHNCGSALAERG